MPQRHDLRIKLANHLLENGDFDNAEAEAAQVIREKAEASSQKAARRTIALSLNARARPRELRASEMRRRL